MRAALSASLALVLLAAAARGEAPAPDPFAQARALATTGRWSEVRELLAPVLQSSPALPDDRAALGWSLVALASAAEGDPASSVQAAERSRAALAKGVAPGAAAAVELNLGWAATEAGNVTETRRAFDAASELGARAGDAGAVATARVHRALLEGRIGSADLAARARAAREALVATRDVATRARLGIALGLALVPERRRARIDPLDALAVEVLTAAYDDAASAREARVLSQALGLMGELQLLRGESRAATSTLGRARSAARGDRDDLWRYRWSWKLGMARRGEGDSSGARESLAEAVELLEYAKSCTTAAHFSGSGLARGYRRAYLDYADALLSLPESAASLERAREVMELSRTSEVADFFRDPCLAERAKRVADPQRLDPAAALVHPLIFDDRIETLVSHRSGIARFVVRVDSTRVAREVQRLRVAAEHPGSDRYRPMAEQLHAWLVAPMEPALKRLGVTTLVWVPDGPLRGLPFAALHDGTTHLAQRYAIAATPVAALTDPRPLGPAGVRADLWGLTVASQGFAALPGVAGELDRLSALLGVGAKRDERFSVDALQDSLKRAPANTLHIASHGQFAPEAARTFLLAYDGRLTLPALRSAIAAGKSREEPLELLVLSACQTAAGDERAALGIAGVAIGAGARSAVATLWAVSDASTAQLVERFYRELVSAKRNRAEALRAAQLSLLAEPATAHPFYWAPFVLIGNWM